MTQEFDELRNQLRRTPEPDAVAKNAALELAMKNFDRAHQGNAAQPRPNSDSPERLGFLKGLTDMISKRITRPILITTTSAAAICLGLLVMPQGWLSTDPTRVPPANEAQTGKAKPPAPPSPTQPEATGPVENRVAETSDPAPLILPDLPPAVPPTVEPQATEPQKITQNIAPQLEEASPVQESVAEIAATADEAPLTLNANPETTPPAAPMSKRRAAAEFELSSLMPTPTAQPETTESFANAAANPVKLTSEEPVSTFSVDVDTASYSVIRSSLMRGSLPPEEAVRIEEMVNYFPYSYPAPKAGEAPFKSSVSVMQTPWNPDTRLVRIGLQGRLPITEERPPLNLVFLIDTSGSMNEPNKLPLLQQSLRLLLPQLRADDEVAIVAYAGSAGQVLPPTRAEDTPTILAALDRLSAGGSTAGAEGLELAYQVAQKMTAKDEVSRVLLATDGDFNVGISDPDGLEAYIEKKRKSGTYLSVLGFGRGNLDDTTMQALAQSGNGMAAYIDTLQEARKVLVDQLSGALFPIADDVKIQVEWNPAEVAEYRLIGYETRSLAREDFNNDKVDAGEIGAGHAVTALYEVTAPDSPALINNPLRYGEAAAPEGPAAKELGFLRLRYKAPGEQKSLLLETPIPAEGEAVRPDEDAKFAAAIAGFGQLLTGGKYLGDWGWDAAIALALEGRGEDAFGYRAEAVSLMRLAKSLAAQ